MTFIQNNLFLVVLTVIAFIFLLTILRRIFVNVGAREIAIKERRYFGRRMPPGRVVATEGEVGIQADVLKPGLHLIKYPFERVVRKVPLIEIGADEIGIVEAVDGEPMLPGRIFALDRAQKVFEGRMQWASLWELRERRVSLAMGRAVLRERTAVSGASRIKWLPRARP